MLGGAAEEYRGETRIAPDPLFDLYMPGLRAAPTDTRGLAFILVASGNPRDRFALRSEVMNKACTL
jgi:hypothetical protein